MPRQHLPRPRRPYPGDTWWHTPEARPVAVDPTGTCGRPGVRAARWAGFVAGLGLPVILKLTGVIAWSWPWVIASVLLLALAAVAVAVVGLLVYLRIVDNIE